MHRQVADLIRSAIMDGRYVPNQRLVESDLAAEYGVGRAAVRAALADLENEYLVVREPNRGARVRTISLDEAIEITEVRAVLEGLIAQKAAERIDEEEAAKLKEILEEMRSAHQRQDFLAYSQTNRALHQHLYQVARHETATRVISNLRAQTVRYQFRVSLMPGRTDVSFAEHVAIVEAVVKRDPEAARAAMKAHMESVITTLRKMPKEGLY
jgi:DNA-binding GntR family transcriptional regulator